MELLERMFATSSATWSKRTTASVRMRGEGGGVVQRGRSERGWSSYWKLQDALGGAISLSLEFENLGRFRNDHQLDIGSPVHRVYPVVFRVFTRPKYAVLFSVRCLHARKGRRWEPFSQFFFELCCDHDHDSGSNCTEK